MASVSNHHGKRLIQFVDSAGVRKTIRLGKCSDKAAQGVRLHIEALVSAKSGGQPLDSQTAAWLSAIGDVLHGRIAATGLVEPRKKHIGTGFESFIERFIAERPDAKRFTLINIRQSKRMLMDYFGGDMDMQVVTHDVALKMQAALKDKGLAEATYRRHLGRCRQFWRAAIKRGLYVGENPFADISVSVRADRSRQVFVPRETIEKCIAASPDAQWRLIIALSRYGGLRTPSETLALTWDCINWEHNRIRVPSPKTEHHKGGDCRIIPMFPELKQPLLDVFEQAEENVPWVITRYRDPSANLRTTFLKIIYRAGLEPWTKLFHNLRASRQTELAENYPLHVVCRWIGNSELVAQEHYLTINDAHFAKAIEEPAVSTTGAKSTHKALQNALQYTPEMPGNDKKAENDNKQNHQYLQGFTDSCRDLHIDILPGMGVEPTHPLRSTGF